MPTIIEEYYVEQVWNCDTCKTQNPGRNKICFSCQKPLMKEEFHDKNSSPVTDENLIVQAKAGIDWQCIFCGSHQRRDNGECLTCGAGLKLSENIELPNKDIFNTPRIVRENRAVPVLSSVLKKDKVNRKKYLSIAGGALILMAVVLFFVWLFTPRYLDAKVSDVYFQHVAHVERNIIAYDSGFTPENGAFEVHENGERIHHHDAVQDGWDYQWVDETVKDPPYCYTTPVKTIDGNCEQLKNGFKKCQKIKTGGDRQCDPRSHIEKRKHEVPRIKDVPVYQTWYTWKIHKWVWNRDVPVTGHTNEVSWPTDADIALNHNCAVGETERVSLAASYSITFSNKNENWKYNPSSLAEYQELRLGSVYHLKVVVGMVTVLK